MREDWMIYGHDGSEKALAETLELHEEWMGDCYVTVTVHSPEPVDFKIGDYLEYRDETFTIIDDPNLIKKASSGSYGEGFTYDNVKLYSDAARMKHIAFNDYVLYDHNDPANKIPYSSMSTFSFFAASVEDLADRIQANLNRVESGVWHVYTPMKARNLQRGISAAEWSEYYDGEGLTSTGKTDVAVTADNLSCWDALKLSYTAFDASYHVDGHNIIIGATAIAADHDFRYGKGLGLYEIERATDENQTVITKLYAYGSERNIPYGYYANRGKKIVIPIRHKTQREITIGNPELILWVDTPWSSVGNAFNGEVRLSFNGLTAVFWASNKTYTYGTEKDDDTLDHETEYLTFSGLSSHSDVLAFYNAVTAGSSVEVTSGGNINKMPSAFVQVPQGYNYDAALSANMLMLPGFPDTSLYDWVVAHNGYSIDAEEGFVAWGKWQFYASKDKQDPWVMSVKIKDEGVREGTANFDESSGHEICPTIEGTGLDVVSWAEQMDDNGYLGDNPKEVETQFGFMPSIISGYEIDWNDTDGEEVTISMKTGSCVGREFKMRKAEKNEDTGLWELTLERYFDSSIGRYFPYNANASANRSLYQVVGSGNTHGTGVGDKFVALGIKLPDAYVELAAKKLLEAALDHLLEVDHHRHTYVPKVDEIYMKRQDDAVKAGKDAATYGTVSVHDTLHAGMLLQMNDTDLKLRNYTPFIDVLTIKEDGNNGIPTYDIVLREEKELTLQDRIQSQIEGGVNAVVNVTRGKGASTADILSAVSGKYLSKVEEDETRYLVGFLGGLMVDGFLKSPEFSEGEWEKVKDTETNLWTKVHSGEGLGAYRDDDGGWHIELDYATIRKMLQTKELSSLKAYFGSEDYYNPEESVLAVQGNAEFSHHLSSPEFQSGFLSGNGWAIKRVEFINAAGEKETRYTLEIDNITVRNTLRVYEMIISQLRGENDNYLFAAMAEVHHYDPESGKVWLSTEGGKIYMPFRPGDYIMVQRYQPGHTGISGADGYVTKSYELVVVDCNSGGEVDENGDRLDWVLFKNFTTQMTHDAEGDYYHTEEEIAARKAAIEADLRREHPSWSEIKVSDEADKIMAAEVFLTPGELIEKGDTFCRLDNESDPERKGIIGITSVGPDTPYIDVMYGRKTDPLNFLKGRIGNLEGIKSEEFGWLQGFGAYLINSYTVGKFCNAQTGESSESRIEATNERLRITYSATLGNINENDNKVSNGFFKDGLDDWTPCDTTGTKLADPTEMEYDAANDRWYVKNPNGSETYSINDDGMPLLMNGMQMEIQKTEKVETTISEGIQVLHLNNAGVTQDYEKLKANTVHEKAVVDDEEFADPTKPENRQPEYDKCTYRYWEDYYIDWLHEKYPSYSDQRVDEVIHSPEGVAWINAQVAANTATAKTQAEYLSSTAEEADKLYLGIRILPLTGGILRVGFMQKGHTWNAQEGFIIDCEKDTKWVLKKENDQHENEDDDFWYFPLETDKARKQGTFLVSYTGECYIRFIVIQNDPISENEKEYSTLFEMNNRRIRMQAQRAEKEYADWAIQYNAIVQRVTDNKKMADKGLKDILGIDTNEDGTYKFPADWFDPDYTYASWIIHTKNRMDFLFTKWDDDDNLIAYSDRTQTADFISEIIVATKEGRDIAQKFKNIWGPSGTNLHNAYDAFYDAWNEATSDNILTAEELSRLKSLHRTLYDMFRDAEKAKDNILQSVYIKNLAASVSPKKDINEKWTALYNAWYAMNTAFDNVLDIPAGSTIDYATMKNKDAIDALNATFDPFETALKNFNDIVGTASNWVGTKLAEATKKITDDFEKYQEDLDNAIAGSYDGDVAFLSWAKDTAISYVKVKAALTEDGNLIDYSLAEQTTKGFKTIAKAFDPTTEKLENISTWVQTAEGFEQEVTNARGGQASLKVRIDGIATTVTNNKNAADTAFNNLNNTVIPGLVSDISTAQSTADNSATWINSNKDRISLISAQFDNSGNLTNTSGLVTGDGSFTTLFATAIDNEMTSTGKLSVYVQKDNNGKIVSGISLSADQLDFTAANITWKLSDTWKINNKNNQTVLSFNNGNLQISGQLTANQTNLTATDFTSTGTVSIGGNFILDNNKKISWKNYPAGTTLSMLTLDNSVTSGSITNKFIVGESMVDQGLTTCIRGKNIRFQTNSTYNDDTILDSDGQLTVKKVKIGDATLEWMDGKGLQVNQNFYSTGALSALGSGTSGSGGGTDLGAVWASLTTHTDAYAGSQIDPNHLTTALSQALSGYARATDLSRYVTLSGSQQISNCTKTLYNTILTSNFGAKFESICVACDTNGTVGTHGGEINRFSGDLHLQYAATDKGITMFNKLRFSFSSGNTYLTSNGAYFTITVGSASHAVIDYDWVVTSDIRKKDLVANIDADVEQIAEAPVFSYRLKESAGDSLSLGSSAQYWQKVFPDAVQKAPDGFLAMNYGSIALAAAVMTARKVMDHEGEIKELKRRIGELEQEVEQLKADWTCR